MKTHIDALAKAKASVEALSDEVDGLNIAQDKRMAMSQADALINQLTKLAKLATPLK